MTITREDLVDRLKQSVVNVIFTKADGSERTMNCTLKLENIPEDQRPKGAIKSESDQIRVFDTDIDAWRSFNFSSVKTIDGESVHD
jgi:hypothetical protein